MNEYDSFIDEWVLTLINTRTFYEDYNHFKPKGLDRITQVVKNYLPTPGYTTSQLNDIVYEIVKHYGDLGSLYRHNDSKKFEEQELIKAKLTINNCLFHSLVDMNGSTIRNRKEKLMSNEKLIETKVFVSGTDAA